MVTPASVKLLQEGYCPNCGCDEVEHTEDKLVLSSEVMDMYMCLACDAKYEFVREKAVNN